MAAVSASRAAAPGLTALPSILFLVLAATWAVVALTLFLGFYAVLWQTIFQEPPEGQEAVWNWRFSIAQLVARDHGDAR